MTARPEIPDGPEIPDAADLTDALDLTPADAVDTCHRVRAALIHLQETDPDSAAAQRLLRAAWCGIWPEGGW